MKIAIAGAGAMGCRFGYMLTKTGQEVTLIDEWPAHIEAIQKNGLKVVDGENIDTIDIKINEIATIAYKPNNLPGSTLLKMYVPAKRPTIAPPQ